MGDQIDLVNCRSCRIPQPALGTQNSGFLCNQRLALALEKSIWASFHGQAPDSSWAGTLSGAQFLELIGQLIELLTSREAEFWPSASTPWNSRATILPMHQARDLGHQSCIVFEPIVGGVRARNGK